MKEWEWMFKRQLQPCSVSPSQYPIFSSQHVEQHHWQVLGNGSRASVLDSGTSMDLMLANLHTFFKKLLELYDVRLASQKIHPHKVFCNLPLTVSTKSTNGSTSSIGDCISLLSSSLKSSSESSSTSSSGRKTFSCNTLIMCKLKIACFNSESYCIQVKTTFQVHKAINNWPTQWGVWIVFQLLILGSGL